ncbi:MAG TPA: arginase family protein [Candidatus Acidoferrales bacterium]|nr:arginase family protein [Candidatus Acidoferrales bacterium]
MAVKIARQANKITLLGAPTSAAAMSAGHEGAPAALRAAGLVERLTATGYIVSDAGDDPVQMFKQDDESPRARNLAGILASIESLKPRVEAAIKSGSLPLILGGDCSIALATVAACRRYFRSVSMIYMDRDADVNTPSTTLTGCVDGMVVSHLTGRGAAELVRFWGEPPLVREPDLALFGVARLDPAEEEFLGRSMLRKYLAEDILRAGGANQAKAAIERIHSNTHEFVLHLDVDVIEGFQATNYPGTGGLRLDDVREALEVFIAQPHLAALEITSYNPAKDPDGSGAKAIVDLLDHALKFRLQAMPAKAASAAVQGSESKAIMETAADPPTEKEAAPVSAGDSWSSEALESESAENPDEPGVSDELGNAAAAGGDSAAKSDESSS